MRKKLTALMMASAMVCGSLIACGTESTTAYASETVYGEVASVNDSGFSLKVGTYENNEMTLTDETADITVNDDTTYKVAMNGEKPDGNGEAPSGEKPEDNGEAPSGEKPEDNSEAPSGEKPEDNGEAPSGEKPEGKGEAPSEQQELSLSSIKEGMQVAVTFDADGNVKSVEILAE